MTAFDPLAVIDPRLLAAVLGVLALVAIARLTVRHWRAAPAHRAHPLRLAALLVAQPLLAAGLYFLLAPPPAPGGARTLVVATADTPVAAWSRAGGATRVALPEAPPLPGLDRAPDLATVLRRHPGIRRIHVVGRGLEARDREAAAGHPLAFDPAPLPRALVELDVPDEVESGAVFRVEGRVHARTGGSVELLDPGAQRIDRAPLAADGAFALVGGTRASGHATYRLRVLDGGGRPVESVALPLHVVDARPARLLVLAGAPGPEVKFLRRWARDAGLPLHTQIEAGAGMQLGDAPLPLDAATLARFDAVVLDERVWAAMGDARRRTLAAAVRSGLGMVLRVTAPLDTAQRRSLRILGFDAGAGDGMEPVRPMPPRADEAMLRARLGPGTRDAPRGQGAPLPAVPMLARRVLRLDAPDALVLHSAAAGLAPATWRAEGRGRVAIWTLADSHALALAGRDDLHHALWADAIATVARPRAGAAFVLRGEARVGERIALCALSGAPRVVDPTGASTPLRIDPLAGTQACAAFWPRHAGWHRLHAGGRERQFHVRAAGEAPGIHARILRDATAALQTRGPMDMQQGTGAVPTQPGPRAPWFVALLALLAATWWLERSRVGRAPRSTG